MGGGGAGSIKSHKLSQNSGDCSQKERSVGCQKRGKILKSNSQFVLMKQIFGHFFTSTHGKHLFWMEGRFVGLSIGRRKFCGRSFHPFLLHGSAETPTLQCFFLLYLAKNPTLWWTFSLIQLKTQHRGVFFLYSVENQTLLCFFSSPWFSWNPTLQWIFSLIQLKTQHCGVFFPLFS